MSYDINDSSGGTTTAIAAKNVFHKKWTHVTCKKANDREIDRERERGGET